MKHFPMMGSLVMVLSGLLIAHAAWAGDALKIPADLDPEFLWFSAQGYLGVDLGEVDNDRVNALRLRDDHAAEVTMVDHDAPAGKSGLKVHDVILQLDGQTFDDAEQLRKRLRELPSGRTVTLLVSRDGAHLNITVQLCDRAVLGHQAWSQHFSVPQPAAPAAGESFLGNAPSRGPAFLGSVIPKGLYVGADLNPVRTQLADYFGVKSGTGLLVENVDDQSPAARAGLKAGDVVVKVESMQMRSKNDWVKTLHNHRGQPVQVTIMRNKQEQILAMNVGKPKK